MGKTPVIFLKNKNLFDFFIIYILQIIAIDIVISLP